MNQSTGAKSQKPIMTLKFINAHMDVAERYAQLSSAERLKVGAVIVKDNRIISIGYNGTPSGWDNCCEFEINARELGYKELKTKPEVLHAESNAIAKVAQSSESALGSALFVTHSPCMECAKLIYQSGITQVYYRNHYRSTDGVDFLQKCNIGVEQLK
jgi:dCMP deaminase